MAMPWDMADDMDVMCEFLEIQTVHQTSNYLRERFQCKSSIIFCVGK